MGTEDTSSLEEFKAHVIEDGKACGILLNFKGNPKDLELTLNTIEGEIPKKLDKKDIATLCLLIKFGTISINAEEYLKIATGERDKTPPPGVWKC